MGMEGTEENHLDMDFELAVMLSETESEPI